VLRLGEVLGTSAQVGVVVGVAAGCDILRDDAGPGRGARAGRAAGCARIPTIATTVPVTSGGLTSRRWITAALSHYARRLRM
jgi:hypothetical protein